MTKNKDATSSNLYGGQAVIEGVAIRGPSGIHLSVRSPKGEIQREHISLPTWSSSYFRRIPYLRGIIVLAETLVTGFKTLSISARIAAGEEEQVANNSRLNSVASAITLIVSLILGIGLFFVLPLWLSELVAGVIPINSLITNIIEGIIRLGIFVLYLLGIQLLKDVKRVFAYHGAEHMTIAAHEAQQPLTLESIRRYPKEHPRCGTAFLLTVAFVSIAVFSLVPREPFWLLVSSRIVLIPIISSISYELIRFTATHPNQPWARILNAPNILAQKLTTRVPDDSMIEVAIDAMNSTLEQTATKS